jgi:transcriptional regulator with XRE-family HTH domain
MDTVGSRIKSIRLDQNLNQKEFCNKIKLGQSRLSEIESNKNKPSFDTLLSIKDVFGVSIDWIISGSEYSNDSNSSLSEDEKELLEKYRSGLEPIFDKDIKRLSGEIGRLNDQEHDLLLKYRKLNTIEQDDIYDNVCWKYDRLLQKKMSSGSKNGKDKEKTANNRAV